MTQSECSKLSAGLWLIGSLSSANGRSRVGFIMGKGGGYGLGVRNREMEMTQ